MDLCPCKKSASRLCPTDPRANKKLLGIRCFGVASRAKADCCCLLPEARRIQQTGLYLSDLCLITSHPPPLGPRSQVSMHTQATSFSPPSPPPPRGLGAPTPCPSWLLSISCTQLCHRLPPPFTNNTVPSRHNPPPIPLHSGTHPLSKQC